MSRWFRFYDEALDDPKVQKLDGDTFKTWVNLLCLASRNGGYLPPINDVAFALRMSPEFATAVAERLLSATLLDKVSGGVDGYRYAPHGWHKRQFKSDTSTERVQRFRKRNETLHETAPETDTESEQNTPHAPLKKSGSGKHLLPADWQVPPIAELPPRARPLAEQWPKDAYEAEGAEFISFWRSERKMKSDWLATWANRIVDQHSRVMRNARTARPSDSSDSDERMWERMAEETRRYRASAEARG